MPTSKPPDDRIEPDLDKSGYSDGAPPAAVGGRRGVVTLKKRAEFQRVRGGAKWSGPGFLLDARLRPAGFGGAGARFGFTITKKIGGAVERNRIRRRFREALRRLPAAALKADIDYVVVARRAALDMDFASLERDLAGAVAKVQRPVKPPATRREP